MPATEGQDETFIRFFVPLVPPSMNSLYNVLYSLRRIELKPEARLFKTKFKGFVPPWSLPEGMMFSLVLTFHQDWFYKKGTWKKADVQNLVKVCVDALCEQWGMDDSRVVSVTASKRQVLERQGIEVSAGRAVLEGV